MRLPIRPPVEPMLAKAAGRLPEQGTPPVWLYEPKWDGFRCIVFRDGDEVYLGSRNTKDLARYFPEVVAAVRAELPERVVLDGELVVPRPVGGRTRLDWEALSERIHPAASRVNLLAEQTPARYVGFDLLALGDDDFTGRPLTQRRAALLDAVGDGPEHVPSTRRVHASIATEDASVAERWFAEFEGAGLDGVIAKRLAGEYVPKKREMIKVKHARTADVVLMGYRPHKSIPEAVGSILLGLYAGSGADIDQASEATGKDPALQMIGGMSAFTEARRRELFAELQALRVGEDVVAAGEANRWRSSADTNYVPLRPELVAEVAYDQMEGARLRHAARFVRWRPDRDPSSCTYEQLEVPVRYDFADVLVGGRDGG